MWRNKNKILHIGSEAGGGSESDFFLQGTYQEEGGREKTRGGSFKIFS